MNVDIGPDFRKCEALWNPMDVNGKNVEQNFFSSYRRSLSARIVWSWIRNGTGRQRGVCWFPNILILTVTCLFRWHCDTVLLLAWYQGKDVMKTVNLKFHLDKVEVVLRNESLLWGQQVGDMRKIKNSGGCLPFFLYKGYAANFTGWFETVLVSFISTRDGKKETRLLVLKNPGKDVFS